MAKIRRRWNTLAGTSVPTRNLHRAVKRMSLLLYVVGAISGMLGMGMFVFGIPVHEFSFGNTLIVAGTTAAVGGLIVIAIGVAVAQLQKVAELLAVRPAVKTSRPREMTEMPAVSRSVSSRIPFPPRPRAESSIGEQPSKDAPAPIEGAKEDQAYLAPMLRNPEMAEAVVEEYEIKQFEEISLSPHQQMPAPGAAELDEQPSAKTTASSEQPAFDAPWRSPPPPPPPRQRPPHSSYFDTLWPAEPRPPRQDFAEEPKFETRPEFQTEPEPKLEPMIEPEPMPEPDVKSEPVVAILKSGVVDGMAYTLYIDGSIEAELPQGTLHFVSINELRDHLAKNN